MIIHHRLLTIRILFCLLIINFSEFPEKVRAQAPVFTETFGTTSGVCDQGTLADGFMTANGLWTVTQTGANDLTANEWYISATEGSVASGACAVHGCYVNASFTGRTLHVGNVPGSTGSATICPSGDCGAIYDVGGFAPGELTDKRAESPVINLTANSTNILVFNYLLNGELGFDQVTLDFFDGSSWISTFVPALPQTPSCGTGSVEWARYSVALPMLTAPAGVKIGFRWVNDIGAIGSNPSFAVDSIAIYNLDTITANITASDTDLCVNDCINFTTDSIGNATYAWTFTGAATPTSTDRSPTSICYNNPGTYQVNLTVVTATDTATDAITIVVNPCTAPTADFIASDSNFCERSCITFTDFSTDGPTGWSWSFPGGVPSSSSSPNPPPVCYDTPGVYDVTLIVFNTNGADTLLKTAYLTVDSCPLPMADFTTTTVQFCPMHCSAFTDNSQYGPITSYQWSFPGGTPDTSSAANPFVCYDVEGLYDVTLIVTNAYGSDTITKYSEVNAQFLSNAFVSPDTAMFFGSSYQLNAGGGLSYVWNPQEGLDTNNVPDPIATPTATTVYTVTISDSAGCMAIRQVTVTILHENDFFVPNTFSPNGDGANDYFYVRGNNIYGMRLTVFDRWGEKVFETNNQNTPWDGTYKGKELNPAVFTYVVTINYDDKKSITQSGSITLVR